METSHVSSFEETAKNENMEREFRVNKMMDQVNSKIYARETARKQAPVVANTAAGDGNQVNLNSYQYDPFVEDLIAISGTGSYRSNSTSSHRSRSPINFNREPTMPSYSQPSRSRNTTKALRSVITRVPLPEKKKIKELESEIKRLKVSIADDKFKHEEELKKRDKKVATLKSKLQNERKETKRLDKEVKKKDEKLKTKNKELAKSKKALKEANNKLDEQGAKYAEVENENKKVESDHLETFKLLMQVQAELLEERKLSKENQEKYNIEIAKLSENTTGLERERDILKTQNSEFSDSIAKLKEKANERLQKCKSKKKDYKNELTLKTKEIATLQDHIFHQDLEIARKSAEVEESLEKLKLADVSQLQEEYNKWLDFVDQKAQKCMSRFSLLFGLSLVSDYDPLVKQQTVQKRVERNLMRLSGNLKDYLNEFDVIGILRRGNILMTRVKEKNLNESDAAKTPRIPTEQFYEDPNPNCISIKVEPEDTL